MKKNFTHESFERFLKENADELQLRPTASLWRRIEDRLNRRRRRVYFTSAFFLVTASLFGYLIIDHSKQPSNPFAAVQTLERKADAWPEPATTPGAATIAASQQTEPVKSRLEVAVSNRNPANLSSRGPLWEPMLDVMPDLASANAISLFTPQPVDEYQPPTESAATQALHQPATGSDVPTIESVVNAYRPKRKPKPEFQLFFTPTISYRRLTENKSYLRAVPQNLATMTLAALYDVNNVVTHKPDLGLEFGFAYKFPITRRIKLRTGMQFNITRYDIKAFNYVPERATIALNSRNRGVDSLNTISSYRNFNGGRPDWIQNLYFQVSTPVGIELAVNRAKKVRFGVAATIQPTYVLGDRAYLISTDYKNYSRVPWLIRRWNANTSLESFVSYNTGRMRWQVGPQVRYQLLSSFVEKYPVKENLFDFGMKVGLSFDKK